jgi:MFS family permease
MYQPTLAFLMESLGWTRRRATGLLVALCLAGSFLVMYFSEGGIFWSTIDDWVGTFLIFVLAMVQIICFSWVFGVDRGLKEAHHGAHFEIPHFYRIVMKYVTPTYLLVVFAAFCWQKLPAWLGAVADEPLRQGAVGLIVAVAIVLIVCIRIGEKRWRAAGLDIDGREEPKD